jgi:hypothetical protein
MAHIFGQEYNQSNGATLNIQGDSFENCTFVGIVLNCKGEVKFLNCVIIDCTILGGNLEFYGGNCVNLNVEPQTIKFDEDVQTSALHIKQSNLSGKGVIGVEFC